MAQKICEEIDQQIPKRQLEQKLCKEGFQSSNYMYSHMQLLKWQWYMCSFFFLVGLSSFRWIMLPGLSESFEVDS